MIEIIQWVATAATIAAALITASSLGARITGIGFGIFLIGSLAWLATGIVTGQSALVWTNAVLTLLNIFGMLRWLGRQAKVEAGALGAAKQSEATPGEALFPLSLLTRAPITAGCETVGHCVDALAGAASGKIRYLVFSDGGVAGVGETLRRIDWPNLAIEGEGVRANLDGGIQGLARVERGQWPAA
ncbi:MAG: PRC-barrel domain containing protein [Sphingomicrobium sp.]